MKRYSLALTLLLIGGFFGIHHFYLGRMRHGIVYLYTFGGFGLGLLHDLVRLNYYVEWANFDADFKEAYETRVRSNPEPSMSFARAIAITVVAPSFSSLVQSAVPYELIRSLCGHYYQYQQYLPWLESTLTVLLAPTTIAFAVWYIGGVGEYSGSLNAAMRAAVYTVPIYFLLPGSADTIATLICLFYFRRSLSYRPRPAYSGGLLYRLSYVTAYLAVICALMASFVLFNCTVNESDGTTDNSVNYSRHFNGTIYCRDALRHFFTSPLWQDIKSSLSEIGKAVSEGGWKRVSETLVLLIDPAGKLHALSVLGVARNANDEDIRRAYRRLSAAYHPDRNKFKSRFEAAEAERRFLEVQQAFKTLQLSRRSTMRYDSNREQAHSVESGPSPVKQHEKPFHRTGNDL